MRKLVDEYRLFVSPVVLGAGTPYFPALDEGRKPFAIGPAGYYQPERLAGSKGAR
jgi:hypothetical protein